MRRSVVTPARLAALAVVAVLLAGCTPLPLEEDGPTGGSTPRMLPPPPDPMVQYAEDRLSVMTLEQKIASMLMVHVSGVDPALQRGAAASGVGGVILMRDNIPYPEEHLAWMTPAMSTEIGLPLLIAIDQEGGVVRRLFSDEELAAYDLRLLAPEHSRTAFAARGALLHSLGVNVNFGIVADVTADPNSFIFDRSLGGTPAESAVRVAQAVVGEHGLVLSTLKHFPGHGVAPGDSHFAIPTTAMPMDEWRAGHAAPFAAGIAAGAGFVMLGHLRFDAVDGLPASLSPTWNAVLREELGFGGIIITDDMSMLENSGEPAYADRLSNAIAAINAGATMLLYVAPVDVPSIVAGLANAVRTGIIDEALIDDAGYRLLHLRRVLSGDPGRFSHCMAECQEMIE